MTTVLVSIGTTVGTLLLAAAIWAIARRRPAAAGRAARPARHPVLPELPVSIDLNEVLMRALATVQALPGVEAAVVAVTPPTDEPVARFAGISEDEARAYAVRIAEMAPVRSMSIVYEAPEEAEEPIIAGVVVVVRAADEPLAVFGAFTRSDPSTLAGLEVELEALGAAFGPAIENAWRFREARRQADFDALTGLHNRRYFHETLGREVARAHRYERRLALILLDLDDFKAVNDRVGHLGGDAVLAEIAERISEVVRSADVPCRVGGDEFAVVLPESTLEDADQLYARLRAAVSARPAVNAVGLSVSAGMAELRPGEGPATFFQRADTALYRAKAAGKDRLAAEPDPTEPSAS